MSHVVFKHNSWLRTAWSTKRTPSCCTSSGRGRVSCCIPTSGVPRDSLSPSHTSSVGVPLQVTTKEGSALPGLKRGHIAEVPPPRYRNFNSHTYEETFFFFFRGDQGTKRAEWICLTRSMWTTVSWSRTPGSVGKNRLPSFTETSGARVDFSGFHLEKDSFEEFKM